MPFGIAAGGPLKSEEILPLLAGQDFVVWDNDAAGDKRRIPAPLIYGGRDPVFHAAKRGTIKRAAF